MSLVSQTARPVVLGPVALRALALGALVAAATFPLRHQIAGALASATPHAPDMVLFQHLSLAVKAHLLAALAALVLGAVLMTARKGRTFHRVAGWGWVMLVAVVAVSSLFITGLNRGHWSLLHLLTGWTMIILPLAVIAARRHVVGRHRRMMMGLFYGGFAINLAFAFIPGRVLWSLVLG
jgi:uncharacterized membrane protein